MSAIDFWKKGVFKCRQQTDIESNDWTGSGKEFQIMYTTTGNELQPTVARRCAGTKGLRGTALF